MHQVEDNAELLRIERVVSRASSQGLSFSHAPPRHIDLYPDERSETPVDEMDHEATGPVHNSRKGPWKPPTQPSNNVAKFIIMVGHAT